jgi:hypothetical protein
MKAYSKNDEKYGLKISMDPLPVSKNPTPSNQSLT